MQETSRLFCGLRLDILRAFVVDGFIEVLGKRFSAPSYAALACLQDGCRAGIKRVVLPAANRKDYVDSG